MTVGVYPKQAVREVGGTSNLRHPDLLTWTIMSRPLIRRDLPFSLHDHLYLVDIYKETSQEVVIKKAAQVGASELMISRAIFCCDIRKLNVMYLLPTLADVSDFVQSRFGPAVQVSPYLSSLIVRAGSGRAGSDKITLKRIRDNFLYFRAATVKKDGSSRSLKSVPADVLLLDELDEQDPRAKEIATHRLDHSKVKEQWMCSTPTFPGVGIEFEYANTDRKKWFVPCPHCGKRQQLLIDQVIIEQDDLKRPVAWHGQDEGRAFIACIKCGKELDRLVRGEWVAENPGVDRSGYHPTQLFSPHVDVLQIVESFKTVDETKRKEALNQRLAMGYEPTGERLTEAVLDDARRDYRQGVISSEDKQRGRIRVFAGVDVGRLFHIIIRAKGQDEKEWRLIYAGAVIDEKEVVRVLKQHAVDSVVVDALPETRTMRRIQDEFDTGIVWLCYYADSTTGLRSEDELRWNHRERHVTADRTRTLDAMYARFVDSLNTLPAGMRNVPDYYDQVRAPLRIIQERTNSGVTKQVSVYQESGPDHFAHAENYCYIASMRRLGWSRGSG